MSKNALPLLTGGLNEVTRSDIIDNTELQVCDNYEVTGDGVLSKRRSIEEYDEGLNSLVSEVFDDVISISQPYYPTKLIKENSNYEQSNDFILFVYGLVSGVYELHLFYKKGDNRWTNTVNDTASLASRLNDENIIYTEESNPEFTITNDRLIITDGVNNSHYILVDPDGKLITSRLGLPAPKQAANLSSSSMETHFTTNNFTETSTDRRLGEPGYVQVTYTVVTKTGEESNPAPLSATLDMSFPQYDSDFNLSIFLSKVVVADLVIPEVSTTIAETLESFKIYIRIIPNVAGLDTKSIELTETFTINNKFDANGDVITFGTTGNTYTLMSEPEAGNVVTFENDVSPIAKTAANIGGITMLGNLKSPLQFTHKMEYMCPITIVNGDTDNYLDAVVTIKMYENEISTDGDFSILDFFEVNADNEAYVKEDKLQHMIFFDEDLTTPMQVYFAGARAGYLNSMNVEIPHNDTQGNEITDYGTLIANEPGSATNWFIVHLKIPFLTAGNQRTIYFTWVNDSNNAEGIPLNYISNKKGYESGMFQQPRQVAEQYETLTESVLGNTNFGNCTIWNGESREGNVDNTLLNYNFEQNDLTFEEGGADGGDAVYLNKANRNVYLLVVSGQNNRELSRFSYQGNFYSLSPQIHPYLDTILNDDSPTIGKRHLNMTETDRNSMKLWKTSEGVLSPPAMEKFYLYWWAEIHSDIMTGQVSTILASLFNPAGLDNFTGFYLNPNIETGQPLSLNLGGSFQGRFEIDFSIPNEYGNFFFCYSTNDGIGAENARASLFVYDVDPESPSFGSYQYSELDATMQNVLSGISNIDFGFPAAIDGNNYDYPKVRFDNITFVRDRYLSANNSTDVEMVWNIVNQQPAYRSHVGKYLDSADDEVKYNGNISFGKKENIVEKEYKNMVRWSDVNSNATPDLNFKTVKEPIIRLIGAPSFLQYQYQNTFLIYTRNNIHRFVLSAESTGWAGSATTLIDEKTQYGLLAPKSLVRVAEGLFWLSETGVVKWDSQGFALISKNRVNVPIHEDTIGFYNSLKNQYILHYGDEAYVYHIDRDLWTKFTGSEMENIIGSSVLTGGTELDNVNLILQDSKIMQYPASIVTGDDGIIKTKDMFFEKGVLKRVQLNYESDDGVTFKSNVTKNKADGTEIVKTNIIDDIENGKWRGVSNANSRGKSVNFEVENADEIESILYDIKLQGQVKQ